MSRGIRLGHILGIPIAVDYSWFIVFGLISLSLSWGVLPGAVPGLSWWAYLLLGVVTTGLLFLSVLIHEVAHSVVAQRHGLPVRGITLFIFGGASQLEEEPASAAVEFRMAVAGPLTSLALAAIFFLAYRWVAGAGLRPLAAVTRQLAFINLGLALFNMLPGFPLDGGRLLRAAIWSATKNLRKATAMAASSGQVFGYVLIALGIFAFFAGQTVLGVWNAFIGWFLLNAAQASYQQLLARQALAGVAVAKLMSHERPEVSPDLTLEQLVHDYLLHYDYNVFPVVEEGRLVGTVGMNEVRSVDRSQWPSRRVREVAKPASEEQIVGPHFDAWSAIGRLSRGECECLFVVSEGQLLGIVNKTDLLRWTRTREQLGL